MQISVDAVISLTCEECGYVRKVPASNLQVLATRFTPLRERNEGPGIEAGAKITAEFPHWAARGDGAALCPKCNWPDRNRDREAVEPNAD